MPSVSVPTAVAVGAGVSGAAAVGGSLISANASQSAADTQANAADYSAQLQQQELGSVQQNLSPFMTAGSSGLNDLMASLGLGGSGTNLLSANGINSLTFQPTQAQLEATPGYQFDLNQGLQATQNSNAAQGLGISGAALKGAASYATGLANNTLTTQEGIFQNNLNNVLSPLTSLASLGENAAAQYGNTSMQGTQAIGNTLVGGANASAAGTIGSANALSTGLSSLGSAPTNYLLYNQLLGNQAGASSASQGLIGDGTAYMYQ